MCCTTAARFGVILFVSLLLAACDNFALVIVGPTAAPAAGNVTIGPDGFPVVTRSGQIFVAFFPSSRGPHVKSRFVLYVDGSFVLQYANGSSLIDEYRGRYVESAGVVTFTWDAWSAAGRWGATGVLTRESLTVEYNTVMQLTDFEDGIYVRVQ
jgi:hypothetical protein